MNINANQKGFTLLELVMVIVILGILVAVAIPKFIDLSGDAQQSAVNRTAGNLSTASSNNYAGCSAKDNTPTPGVCVTVTKCSDAANLLTTPLTLGTAGAAIADQYNLSVDNPVANGAQATCKLQIMHNGTTYTSTYQVVGAGN